MASMSTPIQQLPAGAPPAQHEGKLPDEDPAVTELIQEMTQHRGPAAPAVVQAAAAPRVPLVSGAPPPAAYSMPTAFGSLTPVGMPPAPPQSWLSQLWDAELAQHAVMVAVLAFALFYPADLSAWYARVPFLARFASYDRVLRMVVLAVLVYVIGHFLNL